MDSAGLLAVGGRCRVLRVCKGNPQSRQFLQSWQGSGGKGILHGERQLAASQCAWALANTPTVDSTFKHRNCSRFQGAKVDVDWWPPHLAQSIARVQGCWFGAYMAVAGNSESGNQRSKRLIFGRAPRNVFAPSHTPTGAQSVEELWGCAAGAYISDALQANPSSKSRNPA
jgi:hypothetical protein